MCSYSASLARMKHRIWLLEGEVTTLYEEQLRDLTLVFSSTTGIWDRESRLVTGRQISVQYEEMLFANKTAKLIYIAIL